MAVRICGKLQCLLIVLMLNFEEEEEQMQQKKMQSRRRLRRGNKISAFLFQQTKHFCENIFLLAPKDILFNQSKIQETKVEQEYNQLQIDYNS